MTEAALLSVLTGIFRECFDDPDLVLNLKTSPRDIPTWDSTRMISLLLAVEERFNITMKSHEMDSLRCIGDWVRVLTARGIEG
jgi:acyl carrier protein